MKITQKILIHLLCIVAISFYVQDAFAYTQVDDVASEQHAEVTQATAKAKVAIQNANEAIDRAREQVLDGTITAQAAGKIIIEQTVLIAQAKQELKSVISQAVEKVATADEEISYLDYFVSGAKDIGAQIVAPFKSGYGYTELEKKIARKTIKGLMEQQEQLTMDYEQAISEKLTENERLDLKNRYEAIITQLNNEIYKQKVVTGEEMSPERKLFWAAAAAGATLVGGALLMSLGKVPEIAQEVTLQPKSEEKLMPPPVEEQLPVQPVATPTVPEAKPVAPEILVKEPEMPSEFTTEKPKESEVIPEKEPEVQPTKQTAPEEEISTTLGPVESEATPITKGEVVLTTSPEEAKLEDEADIKLANQMKEIDKIAKQIADASEEVLKEKIRQGDEDAKKLLEDFDPNYLSAMMNKAVKEEGKDPEEIYNDLQKMAREFDEGNKILKAHGIKALEEYVNLIRRVDQAENNYRWAMEKNFSPEAWKSRLQSEQEALSLWKEDLPKKAAQMKAINEVAKQIIDTNKEILQERMKQGDESAKKLLEDLETQDLGAAIDRVVMEVGDLEKAYNELKKTAEYHDEISNILKEHGIEITEEYKDLSSKVALAEHRYRFNMERDASPETLEKSKNKLQSAQESLRLWKENLPKKATEKLPEPTPKEPTQIVPVEPAESEIPVETQSTEPGISKVEEVKGPETPSEPTEEPVVISGEPAAQPSEPAKTMSLKEQAEAIGQRNATKALEFAKQVAEAQNKVDAYKREKEEKGESVDPEKLKILEDDLRLKQEAGDEFLQSATKEKKDFEEAQKQAEIARAETAYDEEQKKNTKLINDSNASVASIKDQIAKTIEAKRNAGDEEGLKSLQDRYELYDANFVNSELQEGKTPQEIYDHLAKREAVLKEEMEVERERIRSKVQKKEQLQKKQSEAEKALFEEASQLLQSLKKSIY